MVSKTLQEELIDIAREAAEVLDLLESGNLAAINTKAAAYIRTVIAKASVTCANCGNDKSDHYHGETGTYCRGFYDSQMVWEQKEEA